MSIDRTKLIGLAGLPASKCFLEVDAIRLSGDRRLEVERGEVAVPFPAAFSIRQGALAALRQRCPWQA
jgi:hypothetical protein